MLIQALGYEWQEDERAPEELIAMGSRNHSYLQSRLTILIGQHNQYTPFTELSIDASSLQATVEKTGKPLRELIPDVAVYPHQTIDFEDDLLRVNDIPLTAIEILSPHQGVKDLVDKFKHYFSLGVKSCWLVYPYGRSIGVYSPTALPKMISSGAIDDPTLALNISIEEVFS